mmetsp:Transcript_22582/g.62846  ORF Transcript_22582/g.62846 Transcript_22582/m.62846 type:complete len:211 (-) Transcript_22582:1428-2060(-)
MRVLSRLGTTRIETGVRRLIPLPLPPERPPLRPPPRPLLVDRSFACSTSLSVRLAPSISPTPACAASPLPRNWRIPWFDPDVFGGFIRPRLTASKYNRAVVGASNTAASTGAEEEDDLVPSLAGACVGERSIAQIHPFGLDRVYKTWRSSSTTIWLMAPPEVVDDASNPTPEKKALPTFVTKSGSKLRRIPFCEWFSLRHLRGGCRWYCR